VPGLELEVLTLGGPQVVERVRYGGTKGAFECSMQPHSVSHELSGRKDVTVDVHPQCSTSTLNELLELGMRFRLPSITLFPQLP